MSSKGFAFTAFCIANVFLGSCAWAQVTKLPPDTTSLPRAPAGQAIPEDIIGGTIFSPDGIGHIVGDGMGGGFVFGTTGISTFISNGMGGGTLYAPNTTGSIIADGMGGGILFSNGRVKPSSEPPEARKPLVNR